MQVLLDGLAFQELFFSLFKMTRSVFPSNIIHSIKNLDLVIPTWECWVLAQLSTESHSGYKCQRTLRLNWRAGFFEAHVISAHPKTTKV